MPSPPQAAPLESGAVLEGLLIRALKVEGPLADELRQLGIDVDLLEREYPAERFLQALDLLSRRLYPERPQEQGHLELGRRFTEGFLGTGLGTVAAAMLKLASPETLLRRAPKNFAVSRPDLAVTSMEEAPRQWRVAFRGSHVSPHFTAGALESMLQRLRTRPNVEVHVQGDGFDLRVTW